MIDLGLRILLAYMVGSILGSSAIAKLVGSSDIREEGSGNAGGTNALRTRGPRFALGVMLIDVGKGVIAVLLIPVIDLGLVGTTDPRWMVVACGAAAVVGHCYPLWHQLRGGKGAATLLGVVAALSPLALVPILLVWVATLVLTGFVGLATILGAAAAPIYFLLAPGGGLTDPMFAFGAAMAAFILFTHRSNVARLRAGSEHRFEKAMIFRRG
jgi:acyl phosphate:glycerol-3-phosphate acyltransferase